MRGLKLHPMKHFLWTHYCTLHYYHFIKITVKNGGSISIATATTLQCLGYKFHDGIKTFGIILWDRIILFPEIKEGNYNEKCK